MEFLDCRKAKKEIKPTALNLSGSQRDTESLAGWFCKVMLILLGCRAGGGAGVREGCGEGVQGWFQQEF